MKLLLNQADYAPVIFLRQEGVTKGDPLSIVLYRITLVPLAEDIRYDDPTLTSPFYVNDAAFDGLVRRS